MVAYHLNELYSYIVLLIKFSYHILISTGRNADDVLSAMLHKRYYSG